MWAQRAAARFRLFPGIAVLAAVILTTLSPAYAGHGFNVVGFGAESLAMAGADIAVARDSAAVNINPAGLAQLERGGWSVYASPYQTVTMSHRDQYGNNERNDLDLGTSVAVSVARRLQAFPDVVVGAGLFAQGGTGIGYEDLMTRYGTRDEFSAIIGISKLVAAVGWQASEQLSLGANLGVLHAGARQKVFPDTSVIAPDPQDSFFGVRLDSGTAISPTFQLGLRYEFMPELAFAMAYTHKGKLPIKGATLTVNYEALDLGRVKYQDAELRGLAVAAALGAGLAWTPRKDLLLSLELEWLNQSSALHASRLSASRPDAELPEAFRRIDQVTALNWRDQYIYAVGVAWTASDRWILRAGLDYLRNPIPPNDMNPTFNVFQGVELTAGFTRKFSKDWAFDFAAQYQLPRDAHYSNPKLPFGSAARERFEVAIVTFSLSRSW